MTVNPLSASSIASFIARTLPHDADPQLKTPVEAVAIACHAGMLSVGFKLVGLGEHQRLGTCLPIATSRVDLCILMVVGSVDGSSSQERPEQLPLEWNANAQSSIDFRYSHPQSSMQYLLKVCGLGAKTMVHGIGMGDDKTTSFDITTKDFISTSALPATPCTAQNSVEDSAHAITTIFITPSRLTDLGSTLRLNIIQKLVPSLQKEGYEDTSTTTSTNQDRQTQLPHPRDPADAPPSHNPLQDDPYQPARPNPLVDPSLGPRRPQVPPGELAPPGFEDPYDINRPARGFPPPGIGGVGGGVAGYGERDLYPPGLGPHDPLHGGLGPGLNRPGSGRGGGGGMYMDLEDLNGRGEPGFNPRAPPGARYDPPGGLGEPPIDPLMGDRRGGGGQGGGMGGMGRFGGMGGAPPNPFGGFGGGDFI